MTSDRMEGIPSPTKECIDRQLAGAVASGLDGDRLAYLMVLLDGFVLRLSRTMAELPNVLRDPVMHLFFAIHENVAEEILQGRTAPHESREVLGREFDILVRHQALMRREGLCEVEVGWVCAAVDDMISRMMALSARLPPDVLPSFTRFALERNREMLDIVAP